MNLAAQRGLRQPPPPTLNTRVVVIGKHDLNMFVARGYSSSDLMAKHGSFGTCSGLLLYTVYSLCCVTSIIAKNGTLHGFTCMKQWCSRVNEPYCFWSFFIVEITWNMVLPVCSTIEMLIRGMDTHFSIPHPTPYSAPGTPGYAICKVSGVASCRFHVQTFLAHIS